MVSEVDEDKRDTRTVEIELKSHEIPTKTATPLHTLDWYIKWVSSIILIIGIAQMHKSNAVPVRGKKQATEVANMRRN